MASGKSAGDPLADYAGCVSLTSVASSITPGELFDDLPGERWRPVVGHEGQYDVSDLGRVRRAFGARPTVQRPLTPAITAGGHLSVSLHRGGKQASYTVHRLVAEAFIGPRPPGKVINHIDGTKTNNRPDNLEYITQAENAAHAARLGLNAFSDRTCGKCSGRGHNKRMCKAVAS